ncbi:MAG: isoprenylcysteine carboxylmethyltransferase family protein [Deltaproteobacteria bacterium]|nr:isoprenylcysteine carboxylmethyltransferase family protein [Deltaproteobacteria bacterium]
MAALPSLLIGGVAFKLSPEPALWPVHAQVLFAVGGVIAVVSFLFLGKSFSILPALRNIVIKGPYRFTRHPAYLGELAMVLACALAKPSYLNAIPFVIGVPLIIVRILAEERLLESDKRYLEYTRKVRFRLVPLIW